MGTATQHINSGNLQQPDAVEGFVKINEIHLWGLGKYAERARGDIERIKDSMRKENHGKAL